MFRKLFIVLVTMFFLLGCNKDIEDIIDGLADNVELNDNQKAELIAAQLAVPTGGLMAELQTLAAASDSQFYSFIKLDTSISYQWINYHLTLSFFMQNGMEIPLYVPGVTDSMTVQGELSGDTTYSSPTISNATWDISLNRDSDMQVGRILSDTIHVHGAGTDSSVHVYNGDNLTLTVQSASYFSVNDVVIPLDAADYIPLSGNVTGAVAGTIIANDVTKEINFPYTVTFNGNATVTVTLTNSGKTFTVNLLTGEVTIGGD